MFISKTEKDRIETRLAQLEINMANTMERLLNLKAEAAKLPRNSDFWTPEQRRIHGDRIRKTWEAKKAAKAAKVTA